MPNCAAAPRRRDLGLAINEPKSVIAPIPGKSVEGKSPYDLPGKGSKTTPRAVLFQHTVHQYEEQEGSLNRQRED
jgi:hypothetical protein